MSGLSVLFQRSGQPVDPLALQAMLDAVPHRAVDGAWTWIDGPVGLGFAKLALTPEDEADWQPLRSPRSGCVIVADARLDNRDELFERLPEAPPPGAPDAELILRAYEAWGADAPPRLLGDFVFAVWDPRQRRLFCARDTHGQRPFVYRYDPSAGVFAAASEIQQLLQDPSVRVEPNEARIRDLLTPYNTFRNDKDRPDTFYAGIHQLEAAHCLVVDESSPRTWRYWSLEPPPEIRYRSDEEYAEHFYEVFSEAVRARLRASRGVGALLSGGLDSSSVVATAHELFRAGRATDHGFTSFTTTYPGLECDESHLVRDLEAKYGFDARYIPQTTSAGWLNLEPEGFQASPIVIPGKVNYMARIISQAGPRVVLNGDVSDSITRGSRLVFDSLIRQGRLRELARHLRVYHRVSHERWRKIVALHCALPLLPLGIQKAVLGRREERSLRAVQGNLLPFWIPETLRAPLSERHIQLTLAAIQARRFSNPARAGEATLLSPPEAARNMGPWPLEVWRPWTDRRVHRFLLGVPPEQKNAPHPEVDAEYAASKLILRRAMRGKLPDSIRTRTHQTHFGSSFDRELELRWSAYEEAFGPDARPRTAERGYIDPEHFWMRLEDQRAGLGERYGNDLIYVLAIVELESWLRALELPWPRRVQVQREWQPAPAQQGPGEGAGQTRVAVGSR